MLLAFLAFGNQNNLAKQQTVLKIVIDNLGWSVGNRSQAAIMFNEILICFVVEKFPMWKNIQSFNSPRTNG